MEEKKSVTKWDEDGLHKADIDEMNSKSHVLYSIGRGFHAWSYKIEVDADKDHPVALGAQWSTDRIGVQSLMSSGTSGIVHILPVFMF